jgi:hypothetical protein
MFRTVFITTSKRISETLLGAALFVVTESTFIVSVHKLGVLLTILIFSTIYSAMSLFLFAWFQRETESPSLAGRFTRWTMQKATALQVKYQRLITNSKFVAIVVASVFAGGLVTTIFIALLGYQGRRAKMYIILQNILSVSVWALFYTGGLRIVFGR